MKHSAIDKVSHVLFVALSEEEHRLRISFRCTPQTFPIRILANAFQNGPDCSFELSLPGKRFFGCGLFPVPCAYALGRSAIGVERGKKIVLGQLSPSKSMGRLRLYGLAGRLVSGDGWPGAVSLTSLAGPVSLEWAFVATGNDAVWALFFIPFFWELSPLRYGSSSPKASVSMGVFSLWVSWMEDMRLSFSSALIEVWRGEWPFVRCPARHGFGDSGMDCITALTTPQGVFAECK